MPFIAYHRLLGDASPRRSLTTESVPHNQPQTYAYSAFDPSSDRGTAIPGPAETPDDGLNAARGLLLSIVLGALIWGLLIYFW